MEVEDKAQMNSIQPKLIRVELTISQELDYLLTLLLWDLQTELKLKKAKKVSNLTSRTNMEEPLVQLISLHQDKLVFRKHRKVNKEHQQLLLIILLIQV